MDAYVDDRLNEGASVSAVRNEINFLKRGLRQAWKKKLLPTLPSFPELVIPDETIRKGFFERAEFDRLLVELPEYMRGVATFMYWTGWRSKSEVLTRQWRHVDLAKGLVHLEAGETKNREPRLFPFRVHPELSAAIDAQRAYTDRMQKELGIVIPWLFHRRGRRFGRAFWTQWKEACTRAGLPGRIPHDFRRTAARNLVEHAGVTEKVAMQLTGHKTANVFERYHITINDDLKAAVAKLAAAPSLAATTPDRSVIPMVDPTRTQKAVGE